jgi:hypothetical protein
MASGNLAVGPAPTGSMMFSRRSPDPQGKPFEQSGNACFASPIVFGDDESERFDFPLAPPHS